MEFKFEDRGDHLLLTASGAYDAADARVALSKLAGAAAGSRSGRLLADLRGITTTIPIHDRYEVAALLAKAGGARLRMAFLVNPDNMFTKTFEDTATNRGMQVRTTDSLAEARKFLGLPKAAT